ncbi:hypothetical protein EV183_003527 [Coemansia sp. RSA 2336]|nr:hypothetical protein EV183_003527 [Coemansia sp. RSA 2336]
MRSFTTAILAIAAAAPLVANAQQCTGNTAMCPNGQDGTSPTYLQCNSWSQQYETVNCPQGQVCYANPTAPDTIMCAPPGSGGVPSEGTCEGHTAKCASPGQSGDYFSCEPWSGQYVHNSCPDGLKCYNNSDGVTVICK